MSLLRDATVFCSHITTEHHTALSVALGPWGHGAGSLLAARIRTPLLYHLPVLISPSPEPADGLGGKICPHSELEFFPYSITAVALLDTWGPSGIAHVYQQHEALKPNKSIIAFERCCLGWKGWVEVSAYRT